MFHGILLLNILKTQYQFKKIRMLKRLWFLDGLWFAGCEGTINMNNHKNMEMKGESIHIILMFLLCWHSPFNV